MKQDVLRFFAVIVLTLSIADASAQTDAQRDGANQYEISAVTLARFSPRARADLVAAIVSQWKLAEAADIKSTNRVHHLIAQMATETSGFRLVSENMNYSAERLLKVFPTRVTAQQAEQLAHKPVAIANHVYGGRLGNRLPNDGWDYRGSGLLQLTGRGNFSARGKELGLPFEDDPEMVRTPDPAFQAAVAYWKARRINLLADLDDLNKVRFAVNGGANGLSEAGIWLARAKRYLVGGGARDADRGAEEMIAVERTLRSLGYLETSKSGERSAPDDLDKSLKQFQRSRGLPETGQVDEDTLYELVDPNNFRKDDR